MGTNEIQENQFKHEKKKYTLYNKGSEPLEQQVSHRALWSFIFGDAENPTGLWSRAACCGCPEQGTWTG